MSLLPRFQEVRAARLETVGTVRILISLRAGDCEDNAGNEAMRRHARKKWCRRVKDVVARLTGAMGPDKVVRETSMRRAWMSFFQAVNNGKTVCHHRASSSSGQRRVSR